MLCAAAATWVQEMPTESSNERASVRHTISIDGGLPRVGELITVIGDEAKHAVRVKRVREGDRVRVLTGGGGVALTEVHASGRDVVLGVIDSWVEPAPVPFVEVCSATPKGPRLEKMIDMLAQVGADCWRPMNTKYGVVDPRDTKLERCKRVAQEAGKQCLRAHQMRIDSALDFEDVLDAPTPVQLVMADASGERYESHVSSPQQPVQAVRVLVGPEGGFTDQEVEMAVRSGAKLVNLGPHVLRIETACVLLASLVRNSKQ